MRRPAASGLGFAVADGVPSELGRLLQLDPPRSHQPGRRRLLAVVEPVDPTGRGHEVAEVALAALREGFWRAAGQPLASALGEAFAAANAAVRDENRLASGEGRERHVGVGASAIALEGRRLVLAQVPPSQAILVQEGRVYAFPDLASWGGHFLPADDRIEPDPEPLGCREQANPDLFRTLAAPDDLIVLCASAIPSCLVREGANGDGPLPDPLPDFEALLEHGDADDVAGSLAGVAETHGLADVHAACCTVGRLHSLDTALAREAVARLALSWGIAAPTAPRGDRVVGAHGRPRGRGPGTPGAPSRGRPAVRAAGGVVVGAGRRRRAYGRVGLALDDEPDPDREPSSEPDSPRPRPIGGETGTAGQHRPLAESDGQIGVLPDPVAPTGPRIEVPAAVVPDPSADSAPDPRTLAPSMPRSFDGGMYVGMHPRRAHALDALHLRAAHLGERLAPRRPTHEPRAGRLVAGLAPGALGIERHRRGAVLDLPGGWHLAVPLPAAVARARRFAPTALALLLVLFVAGVFGRGPLTGPAERVGLPQVARRVELPGWTGLSAGQDEVATGLAAVDARIAAAAAAEDPVLVARELVAAEGLLAEAVAKGADGEALATRQAALVDARDRLAGVVRLGPPIRVVTLPAPATGQATLLVDGGGLVVATDALYRYEGRGQGLDRLAAAGDGLDAATIGPVRGAAREEDGIAVTDGVALFWRDAAGSWSSRMLPAPAGEGAGWPVVACGVFDGHFYLLDVDTGRILKFAADDPPGAPPRDWAGVDHADELRTARDMVVDGRIHVLLADGRVLAFFRGELERTYELPPDFPVADPAALFVDDGSYYVLDRGDGIGDGRLYRIDRETGETHELKLPPTVADLHLLAAARDLAVDEAAGALYLLTDEVVWRSELP
jgi:hypothetical protein